MADGSGEEDVLAVRRANEFFESHWDGTCRAHVVEDVVVVLVLVVAEVVVVENVVTKLELEPDPVPEPEIAISA